MSIESMRKEVLKQILELENEAVLKIIYEALSQKRSDFWEELTSEQQKEILVARKQIANGQTEEWETLKKRLHNSIS